MNFAPAPGRPQASVSDMQVFPMVADVVGASVLTRYTTSIEGTAASTSGLAADGAYSTWAVVFNHPEFCVDGRGLDDLPVGATRRFRTETRAFKPRCSGRVDLVANGTGAAQVGL